MPVRHGGLVAHEMLDVRARVGDPTGRGPRCWGIRACTPGRLLCLPAMCPASDVIRIGIRWRRTSPTPGAPWRTATGDSSQRPRDEW